ncbi:MAG: methylated-DNA--[protein]-cysteine S-methyltransferase [Clostridiaceae bacterium]|nr:methylated-DNA--[protein]-cysteine S-methyltransferase [Clostridiaceae bacterium]
MNNAYCYETKIGKIIIVENGSAITRLYFGEVIPKDVNVIETPLLERVILEFREYLCGKRKVFDFPLAPQGTEFQQKVWKALKEIPYGKTYSYKDVAISIGNEKACRAVGMANNKNPILIFIPCHRVIGATGNLVGYAGGLEVKKTLLAMEQEN